MHIWYVLLELVSHLHLFATLTLRLLHHARSKHSIARGVAMKTTFFPLSAHQFDGQECDVPVTSAQTLLLSNSALTSGCARANAPWPVRAASGQRMNISVYDFSSSEQRSERVLGKIVDIVTSQQGMPSGLWMLPHVA